MGFKPKFLSINLHLTQACNMNCKMCFAKYPYGIAYNQADWSRCIDAIAEESKGIPKRKMNFVGGEPTLLPYLPDLVERAKGHGFITGIVTNGSRLNSSLLNRLIGSLDWIGLSIDSLSKETNRLLGRCSFNLCLGRHEYEKVSLSIRENGFSLKINTAICSLNHEEDFVGFLMKIQPERWKVMQCLIIENQNMEAGWLGLSDHKFREFIDRHSEISNLVVESCDAMLGSYIMVDPCGRPYGNESGRARFGLPVLEAGLFSQLVALGYTETKALTRGAAYF